MWMTPDIERIAMSLCLTNETDDFRRGVVTLAMALGVIPNNQMKLPRGSSRDLEGNVLYRSGWTAYPDR